VWIRSPTYADRVIGLTPIVIIVNAKSRKETQERSLPANPVSTTTARPAMTILHLAAAMFFDEAGVTLTHAPE
jgi:hypothetical protein